MGELDLDTDLAGSRAVLYRVWRDYEDDTVKLAVIPIVKETPKLWFIQGCPAVGHARQIDKDFGFVYRTQREAMDDFKLQCTNDLKAANEAVERAKSSLIVVNNMLANQPPPATSVP